MRFPDFSDEWERKRLGDVGEIITGSTPPTNDESFYDGDCIFVSPADIQGNRFISQTKTTLTKKGFQKGRAIRKGSTLFVCIGSTIGKVGQAAIDCITNQQINSVIPIDNDDDFVFSMLDFYSLRIKNLSAQQAVPIINKTTFSDVEIKIPSLLEQQRISSFLSFLDERIATQSKIIEGLQSLMKGLCEKIFSQQIRFKDDNGNDFPEWEEKRLDDIGETYNGLSGKTKDNFGQGKKYIQYKQIFDSSKIRIEDCGLVDISENENQNQVQYGDILFTTSSETPEEIGMSSVLLEVVENIFFNSFCFGFRPNSLDILKPQFAQYFFRSEVFRNEIIALAQGSTRYNLSKIEFMKLPIKLPDMKEQTHIANFLSSLDEKIQAEKQILQQYEKQKKYLLQNMFI